MPLSQTHNEFNSFWFIGLFWSLTHEGLNTSVRRLPMSSSTANRFTQEFHTSQVTLNTPCPPHQTESIYLMLLKMSWLVKFHCHRQITHFWFTYTKLFSSLNRANLLSQNPCSTSLGHIFDVWKLAALLPRLLNLATLASRPLSILQVKFVKTSIIFVHSIKVALFFVVVFFIILFLYYVLDWLFLNLVNSSVYFQFCNILGEELLEYSVFCPFCPLED